MLLCICSWGWRSRASLNLLPDGCGIAPTDPRAELLPKHSQNQRLLQRVARLIKPSGCSEPIRAVAYGFIHTSFLFCSTSLPIIGSYPDILYEIKIQAVHVSHCEPLQSRFLKVHPDLGQYLCDCKSFHSFLSEYTSKPQTNVARTEMKHLTTWSPECQNCITVYEILPEHASER